MKKDKLKAICFLSTKGLHALPFPKVGSKSPDLQVYLDEVLFGYCEVKSIVKYEWCGERNPHIWNNIQNKIHEARKQFDAVNADHSLPNILLLINHDSHYNWMDLYKVLNGKEPIPDLPVYETRHLRRLAKVGDLMHVDFIIWLDSFIKEGKPFQTVLAESKFKDLLKDQMSDTPSK